VPHAAVTRRQAELQTRYGPLHPDVLKVERELADTATTHEMRGTISVNLVGRELQLLDAPGRSSLRAHRPQKADHHVVGRRGHSVDDTSGGREWT